MPEQYMLNLCRVQVQLGRVVNTQALHSFGSSTEAVRMTKPLGTGKKLRKESREI